MANWGKIRVLYMFRGSLPVVLHPVMVVNGRVTIMGLARRTISLWTVSASPY